MDLRLEVFSGTDVMVVLLVVLLLVEVVLTVVEVDDLVFVKCSCVVVEVVLVLGVVDVIKSIFKLEPCALLCVLDVVVGNF